MSDPLKKDEIEDVLSSIRRLVSEDVRSLAEPEAVTPSEKPAQVAADKLVLTPSLRVGEEAATEAPRPETTEDLVAQEVAKSLAQPQPEAGPRVLTLSKTGADVIQPEDPVEAKEPEPKEAELAKPELAKPAEKAPEAQEEAAATSEIEDAQELPAVEWQSVRSYSEMEFDPEAAGDGDYAGTEVDAIEWGQSADKPAAETKAADAVIDAEVIAEPKAEEPPYEAVLDEEMLRDLVGEIVRQELQGPLGERITRNVRKLVRREINRALASRQID